jgi:hypothetical protein
MNILRRASVRNGKRIGHGAARVRDAPRFVRNCPLAFALRNHRVAVDAELRPAILHHAEETVVVIVALPRELVEMIDAQRRPLAVKLEHHRSLRRLEARFEYRRRRFTLRKHQCERRQRHHVFCSFTYRAICSQVANHTPGFDFM